MAPHSKKAVTDAYPELKARAVMVHAEAVRVSLVGQHLDDAAIRDATAAAFLHHTRQLGFQRL